MPKHRVTITPHLFDLPAQNGRKGGGKTVLENGKVIVDILGKTDLNLRSIAVKALPSYYDPIEYDCDIIEDGQSLNTWVVTNIHSCKWARGAATRKKIPIYYELLCFFSASAAIMMGSHTKMQKAVEQLRKNPESFVFNSDYRCHVAQMRRTRSFCHTDGFWSMRDLEAADRKYQLGLNLGLISEAAAIFHRFCHHKMRFGATYLTLNPETDRMEAVHYLLEKKIMCYPTNMPPSVWFTDEAHDSDERFCIDYFAKRNVQCNIFSCGLYDSKLFIPNLMKLLLSLQEKGTVVCVTTNGACSAYLKKMMGHAFDFLPYNQCLSAFGDIKRKRDDEHTILVIDKAHRFGPMALRRLLERYSPENVCLVGDLMEGTAPPGRGGGRLMHELQWAGSLEEWKLDAPPESLTPFYTNYRGLVNGIPSICDYEPITLSDIPSIISRRRHKEGSWYLICSSMRILKYLRDIMHVDGSFLVGNTVIIEDIDIVGDVFSASLEKNTGSFPVKKTPIWPKFSHKITLTTEKGVYFTLRHDVSPALVSKVGTLCAPPRPHVLFVATEESTISHVLASVKLATSSFRILLDDTLPDGFFLELLTKTPRVFAASLISERRRF